ncbi:transglycosylase SLT domain-containing protein [Acidithiobacillus thiooxidans]|uniref:transglycosylase SLT domain-containing protein n=1 Tax=Acidithiobacillus thiooxidans TaxID=930 RepID=UPI0035691CCE
MTDFEWGFVRLDAGIQELRQIRHRLMNCRIGALFYIGVLCMGQPNIQNHFAIPPKIHLKTVALQGANHCIGRTGATPSQDASLADGLEPPSARSRAASHWQILAGPYVSFVRASAKAAHISPVLVAAVIYVENGGDFVGSATRVSSAGAIGVMQLEPVTAWDVLRVNPWQAASNIAGGARFLHDLLKQFHGNVRLALMAYNAGPTLIARGGRPAMAVRYAYKVLQLIKTVRF